MLDKLHELKEQVARRAKKKEEYARLEAELAAMDKELFALNIDAHNQQVDVDLLNAFSLKNLYYDLTGKKEAMLAKETMEARSAKEKLNNARFYHEQLSRELQSCKDEVNALSGCEAKYWELLNNAAASDPHAGELLQLRKTEILDLLDKAHLSCDSALEQAYDTLKNIDHVMQWNNALAGTGWTMAMPGYLNSTQKHIETFRGLVRDFCRMLDSLPLPAEAMIPEEEILIFPKDYFRELTGRIGANQRLYEADTAMHDAKDRLFEIRHCIENLQKELS